MPTTLPDIDTIPLPISNTSYTIRNTNLTVCYTRPKLNSLDWLNIANGAKQRFTTHIINDRWEGEYDSLRLAVKKAATQFR